MDFLGWLEALNPKQPYSFGALREGPKVIRGQRSA